MEESSINILDVVVAVVVLVSALFAFYRGFVREALAIAGWVGAAFATVWLYPVARPFADEWLEEAWLGDVATGATIFLVSLVILWLVAHAIVIRVKDSPLNALDRSLGFLFGLARGVVLVALAYMVATRAFWHDGEARPRWLAEARSLPVIDRSAGLLIALVPEGTFNLPVEGFDAIQKKAEDLKEAGEMIKELSEPPVAPADGDGGETGYKESEITIKDRLIESLTGDKKDEAQ